MISDDLRGRIYRAARELPLPSIDRRTIDCRLSAEDWRGLVFELRTIATRPGCAPLAALADDVRTEVRS